ncbi:penicillin-binding protein 2 [Granulicella mallensis]|uniref:Penicillin-binding protein 2 n=1 Tax=Granulicella mallensis (strain ATCC BAA-1857 / DSM 23137 / MP5ACTX8) TaxID=682795 RepID=G8P268_GRAMM|nr:penicillin-binding protein 2 [Granulicella mallensis]AEU38214.1 penicillin-binding protein 2 [Granulicella mallensis MP5ACTX8]
MEIDSIERNEKLSPVKLHMTQYLVAVVLVILGVGLWRLQVLGATGWRVLAEQNRIRKVPVLAPRGKILDREGRIIVDNYPSVTCYLLREQQKNLDADLPQIANGLHMTVDQIQAIIKHFQLAAKYQPIPLKQDITPDEQAFVEAHRNELPELETLDEQRRLYPRDGFAAHLIGYVGEVSENDLNQSRYAAYAPGDVVGKSGVEETYDEILRGVDGSRDMVVNSHGKEVGLMGQELAQPGQDLRLTIDLDIQMAAEKALEGKIGAIVAMDPHTGEILAMASRPTFDPNQFSVRLTKAYWQSIMENPDHPMMNKTIQAQLAPGSTFKVIMTLAGLQENVAQDMHVQCNGGATFYGHFFACDRHHGGVDIHNALPYSCDTFYYTLANKLGIDTIARYATSVGIGSKTGVDLPDEAAGVMPSEQWKLKTQHDKWYAGETISVGIGQGAIEATPLQLARALGGIASGGALQRPHVVFPTELTKDQLSAVQSTYPGSGEKTVPLTPENWQIITDDMAGVTGPIGTAAAAHLEGVDFAGKTGTAQVMSHTALAMSGRGHNTEPNAWFVGIAPRRNPDIVVAVLWEHGVWGNNSAKLAAQVVTAFVNKQRAKAGNLQKVAEKPAETPAGAGGTAPAAPAGQ